MMDHESKSSCSTILLVKAEPSRGLLIFLRLLTRSLLLIRTEETSQVIFIFRDAGNGIILIIILCRYIIGLVVHSQGILLRRVTYCCCALRRGHAELINPNARFHLEKLVF